MEEETAVVSVDSVEHEDVLPYKIVDVSREKRFGVVASSLNDLIDRAKSKLGITGSVKIVLEQDGTEVDEEEYFGTLEKNTSLMVLTLDQNWSPPGRRKAQQEDFGDQIDGGRGIQGLLQRLQSDIGQVSLLGGCELELLSDMDPDSLTDIVQDRVFLDQLKEASGRFLSDKRQAKEAIDLLKLYHRQNSATSVVAASSPTGLGDGGGGEGGGGPRSTSPTMIQLHESKKGTLAQ